MAERPEHVNPYKGWRRADAPEFNFTPIQVDIPESAHASIQTKAVVRASCMAQYHRAMTEMEHSVGEVASSFVRKDGDPESTEKGPVLEFADTLSRRYLDLYQAYAEMEKERGIPMLPLAAGQLKMIGLDAEQIVSMKESCKGFVKIYDEIAKHFNFDMGKVEKFLKVLVKEDERKKELEKGENEFLIAQIVEYQKLEKKDLIDKAFALRGSANMSVLDIASRLYDVSVMSERPAASVDERLLMEIRHRIAGDQTLEQRSLGYLGSNPLAYKNVIERGEPENLEAEFRERMYFVYKSNHFVNNVIKDPKNIEYINKWLKDHGKDWQLDSDFIDAVNARVAQKSALPPIFVYAVGPQLNRYLRKGRSDEEMKTFMEANPNPTVADLMNGLADINAFFKMKLSERELMNQTGEWHWSESDKNVSLRAAREMNFVAGAAYFDLIKDPSAIPATSPDAQEYLKIVNQLRIPVVAGISGTMDQGMTMAGLVGMGISGDLEQRRKEQEMVRLAYIAFMVPGHDHSVHEILQSSTSFDLEYQAGPGFQKYIFPEGGEEFIQRLEKAQQERGTHLPDYFLSPEFVLEQVEVHKQHAAAMEELPKSFLLSGRHKKVAGPIVAEPSDKPRRGLE